MHANGPGVLGRFSIASALLAVQMGRADFPLYKKNVNCVPLLFSILTFINLAPCFILSFSKLPLYWGTGFYLSSQLFPGQISLKCLVS